MARMTFSALAQANIDETGIDPWNDIDELRNGNQTPDSLLEYCLDGADPDREQGWREYVAAVVQAARDV